MDRDDRAGARCDGGFRRGGIQVEAAGIDVGEHGIMFASTTADAVEKNVYGGTMTSSSARRPAATSASGAATPCRWRPRCRAGSRASRRSAPRTAPLRRPAAGPSGRCASARSRRASSVLPNTATTRRAGPHRSAPSSARSEVMSRVSFPCRRRRRCPCRPDHLAEPSLR